MEWEITAEVASGGPANAALKNCMRRRRRPALPDYARPAIPRKNMDLIVQRSISAEIAPLISTNHVDLDPKEAEQKQGNGSRLR
jgi:hypothetical protein